MIDLSKIQEAKKLLKQYFGYDEFRQGQEQLIEAALNGQDVLGIMPTGAGKSLCFQIPALMMDGITLVISPLISLMKDQVGTLNQAGIHAAFLNSSLTQGQYHTALKYAMQGRYKIIYVAPERLETEGFINFALNSGVKISMLAVDEAHCVSQWGQDFRPSYLKILEFLKKLPYRPVLTAYTATATAEVRDDIMDILNLRDPFVLTTGFDRENLYYAVKRPRDKYRELLSYLKEKGELDVGRESTFTPGPVHRLDRNTSGIVIFGKTLAALQDLNEMMKKRHHIEKSYMTICKGKLTKQQELVGYVKKIDNEDRVRFVKKDDKDALMMKTIVKPIRTTNDFSLVEVKIITGRMHQIRIHLSSIDHPVIGDRKYGDFVLNKQMKQQFGLNNQLLHAYKINFVDPFGSLSYLKGKKIICPKPTQFKKIEKSLFESVL